MTQRLIRLFLSLESQGVDAALVQLRGQDEVEAGDLGCHEYELRRCDNCHPAHGAHFLSGYHDVIPLWKARPLTGPSSG